MQIEDILVGDKQLAKEILYDIKQAEQAKEGDAATNVQVAATAAVLQPQARPAVAVGQPGRASSAHAVAHQHTASPLAGHKQPGSRHRRSSGQLTPSNVRKAGLLADLSELQL